MMSTKIEDLPSHKENVPSVDVPPHPVTPSNISMEIKKKNDNSTKPSLWEQIKLELNEDTLLIAVFIFLGTLSTWDNYIYKLPLIGNNLNTELLMGLVKAAILTIIYTFVKKLFKNSM